MRLTFRQGIARYQTDVYSTPTFLQKSSQSGEFIDLIVSPDPTIIIFAHRDATYVVEESKTVFHAWGPFITGQGGTRWLYWDINLLTAALSRGYTSLPPIVAAAAPANPANDQHWFDTTEKQMKVWNGSKWVEKIRVFAGSYSSQAVIHPMPLGTQAGETGDFEAGDLVLDAYNKPIRQSDGTFLTTSTKVSVTNTGTKQFQMESDIVSGMADEYIPKFSFVQLRPNRRLALARSDDWRTRIIGIVTEDLYLSEVGIVGTSGLVRNEQWSFPPSAVGKRVFSNATGQLTLVPPTHGVCQIAGYVFDHDTIYLDIKPVTILDDMQPVVAPPAPAPLGPIADFTVSPTVGTFPLSVRFTSTSLHNPTEFQWDIGNRGATDSTQSAFTHTFTQPGTYSVKLRVSSPHGSNEIVKTDVVVVNGQVERNIQKNLGIQLIGPLQVGSGQTFPVKVLVSNDGRLAATNVARTIVINDMGSNQITVTGAPTGTTTYRDGRKLVVVLPVVPSIVSGQFVQSNFSIVTPAATGTLQLQANVVSPEADAELSDNTTELSIRVR